MIALKECGGVGKTSVSQFHFPQLYGVIIHETVVATECCVFHHGNVSHGEGQIFFTYPIPIASAFKRSINLSVEKILRFTTIWLHNHKHFIKTFGPFLKQNFFFKKSIYCLQENKKIKISPPNITFFFLKKKKKNYFLWEHGISDALMPLVNSLSNYLSSPSCDSHPEFRFSD